MICLRVLFMLLCAPRAVALAQDAGWEFGLKDASTSDRPTAPTGSTFCIQGIAPGDSILLVAIIPSLLQRVTASVYRGETGWHLVYFQNPRDTLRGSFVGGGCEAQDNLVIESRQRYIQLGPSQLARIDATSGSLDESIATVRMLKISSDRPRAVTLDPVVTRRLLGLSFDQLMIETASVAREELRSEKQRYRDSVATSEKLHADSVAATHWSVATKKLVRDRRVAIGMTAPMVRLSWGDPEEINRTILATGSHEQWVYGGGTYIYLTNGRVSSIQDKR
jgi:hypothetical protein